MAEVPEVEILVRDLCEAVVGRSITSAQVVQPVGVRFPTPQEFTALLVDRAILDANRRAKFILISLSGDVLLAVHLMIGGTLRLLPGDADFPEATLVVFHLDGDQNLVFYDKLGYARAAAGPAELLRKQLDLDALGPEVIDPDFNTDILADRLLPRRGVLKTVLLNQRVLAGLGNRDADESMWLAGIDPRRPASSLTADELQGLYAAMNQVLQEGISLRGTQRDLFGRQGLARQQRNIFDRPGEPCPRCRTRIQRIRIGGRNTHFCPNCQR